VALEFCELNEQTYMVYMLNRMTMVRNELYESRIELEKSLSKFVEHDTDSYCYLNRCRFRCSNKDCKSS
jgi:hypothetical protein